MYRHAEKYFAFKDHPFLEKRVKTWLAGVTPPGTDERKFYYRHLRFIYPKVLTFSPRPYPKGFGCYLGKDAESAVDGRLFRSVKTVDEEDVVSSEVIVDVFKALNAAVIDSKESPYFILDLRYCVEYDADIIHRLIAVASKYENKRFLLFLNENIKKILSGQHNSTVTTFYSAEEFKVFFESAINDSKNVCSISLVGEVTVDSLEKMMRLEDVYTPQSLVINLDFSRVISISSFSIGLLSTYIHSLAHEHGVLFSFTAYDAPKKVLAKLKEFRFFRANRFFLKDNPIESDKHFKTCGLYLFDESVFHNTLDEFDSFLLQLRRYFPNQYSRLLPSFDKLLYLSQKAQPRRIYFYTALGFIVSELLENVIRHSGGTGYFSIHLNKSKLHIFIGDTGRGLVDGLRDNYELDESISEDQQLEGLFDLLNEESQRRTPSKRDKGGGKGLLNCFNYIAQLKGRIVYRTNRSVAVQTTMQKDFTPQTLFKSRYKIVGTQYMIVIPFSPAIDLPKNADDILAMRD